MKEFLDSRNIAYELSEHEPVYTSVQAAAVRGAALKTGVKALVFSIEKTAKKEFILVLVPADRRADISRLPDAGSAKLAKPDEVLAVTGCEAGSVHPFGNLFGLKIFMDKKILENEYVNFNAGLHTASISMRSSELVELVKPVLGCFSIDS